MGFGGMSVGSLLLILLIVVVLFGTKRLRGVGEDIGAALKSFRKGMAEGDNVEAVQAKDPEKSQDQTKE